VPHPRCAQWCEAHEPRRCRDQERLDKRVLIEATIQLASSLRNLSDAEQAASLLTEELRAASDELDGAVRAFLALALVDLGREREAVAVSLEALSRYLPRYNRSLARYAHALVPSDAR
jgi:hypothetical protein